MFQKVLASLLKKHLENVYKITCQEVLELEQKYYNNLCSKKDLIEKYNKMYIYKYKLEILTKKNYYTNFLNCYKYDKDKVIFTIDHEIKNHDIDYSLLNDLDKKEYYTLEEAENLIKWTVNNTRENLRQSNKTDNLNNFDLMGCCGFSQFSSIYPLEKLGLKVTYNNTANFFKRDGSHAYGTVEIPVMIDGKIVKKSYIIDCTYSQFFFLKNCVEEKYLNANKNKGLIAAPMAGYFMDMNDDLRFFAKNMLEDGYCEMTDENLKKYAYGLYMQEFGLNQAKEAMREFQNLNLKEIINSYSSKSDYDEEEFIDWGHNLEIGVPQNKKGR